MIENSNKIIDNHLVDFDCLYDTRLPILEKCYGRDFVEALVATEPYFGRESDFFYDLLEIIHDYNKESIPEEIYSKLPLEIDPSLFKEAWDNRKKEDILDLFITKLFSALADGIQAISKGETTELVPYEGKAKVTINTYPYTFTEQELGILKEGFAQSCYFLAEVTIVRIAPEDLTHDYLKQFTDWIVYKLDDWLIPHANIIPHTDILKELKISTVARWRKPPDENEDIMKLKEIAELSRMSYMPLFNLTHIDPELFCIDRDAIESVVKG